MTNYIETYAIVQRKKAVFRVVNNVGSSVSIEPYLKEGIYRSGYAKNIMIDMVIVDWLDNNVGEGNWFLDMCGKNIWFKNDEDTWRFLEWLEEYELQND